MCENHEHPHKHEHCNHDHRDEHHVHLGTCSHGHDGHHHHHPGNKKGLLVAFLVTVFIVALEMWGSFVTNSLSLLSDSGHMVGDAVSLLLSLMAILMSHRATRRIQGYTRFEIGASLFNGLTILILAGWVIWEAYMRFLSPQPIHGGLMMVVAVIGLIANLFSAWFMSRNSDVKANLNVRSAYLHVLMDAWSSVGVIVSGLVIYYLEWTWIDPVISVVLAILIAKGGVRVVVNVCKLILNKKGKGGEV